MAGGPRDYDREFTTTRSVRVRRRLGYSHVRGEVTRFVVQLEYRLNGEWVEVVRSDHDPESNHGHDVTAEGVHVDVYRNGEKIRVENLAPPMPAAEALTLAETHFREHAERYVERFKSWHGIRRGSR